MTLDYVDVMYGWKRRETFYGAQWWSQLAVAVNVKFREISGQKMNFKPFKENKLKVQ